MTLAIFHKLLAIFLTVGLGYLAARLRWFGEATPAVARLLLWPTARHSTRRRSSTAWRFPDPSGWRSSTASLRPACRI